MSPFGHVGWHKSGGFVIEKLRFVKNFVVVENNSPSSYYTQGGRGYILYATPLY